MGRAGCCSIVNTGQPAGGRPLPAQEGQRRSRGGARRWRAAGGCGRFSRNQGQVDGEDAALARQVAVPDHAAVALDAFTGNGQTEPQPRPIGAALLEGKFPSSSAAPMGWGSVWPLPVKASTQA